PLRPVVLGLVVVVLNTKVDGWDLLADPVGWVLVLLGSRALPVRRRGPLLVAAALALVVAAVLWPPGVADRVAATDDSLSWALSLPQSAYLVLLADGLRDAAARGDDPGLRTWWTTTTALAAAALVLPVLVLGGDLDALGALAALVSLLTVVLVVVLGLASARATWAGGPGPGSPTGPTTRPPRGPDSDSGPNRPRAS
ncbi:MAG TPA: hypothetical protein VGE43_00135, partial [Acidimicrobiales bacterium]